MRVSTNGRALLALLLVFVLSGFGLPQAQAQDIKKGDIVDANRFKALPLEPISSYTQASVGDGKGGKLLSVLIKLDFDPLASYRGGVAGLAPTAARGQARLDVNSLESQRYLAYAAAQADAFEAALGSVIAGSRPMNRYLNVFGGVSALVPATRLNDLMKVPGVVRVLPDELQQPEASNTEFIGAPTLWDQLGGQASAGENVIVGVIDTGVWPEHPSFANPDPLGKAYAALAGSRPCQFSGGANPGPGFTCNRKLIGAMRFMTTYEAVVGLTPLEFTSARDDDGHGTHVASTAAGNRGVAASTFGIARGAVSGVAPRARVMSYKVCGIDGCYSSDQVAAINRAVTDQVNVINLSIGGGTNPYADPVELAFLDAYNAGIFIAAAGGNSGPAAGTVNHRGPWVTTVAASNTNQGYFSSLVLRISTTQTLTLRGATISAGIAAYTPLVNASSASLADPYCLNSTADGKMAGKIVICRSGTIPSVQKSFNVKARGAVGMIVYNTSNDDVGTPNYFIPAVMLGKTAGTQMLSFVAGQGGATARFSAGAAGAVPGDVVASFSSRGSTAQALGISKPDLAAPGVKILAGYSPAPASVTSGVAGQLFGVLDGTSMASPHVAGAAALLLDLHPGWTPGQIKSALMTTAKTAALYKEDGVTPADPFDVGSGRIDLSKAGSPGILFDVPGFEFADHAADLWNTNYPSIYLPTSPGIMTVQRTVHSDLAAAATWTVQVVAPPDLKIAAPPSFVVPAYGDFTLSIRIDSSAAPLGQVRFASLVFKSGTRVLRMPVTAVRQNGAVTLTQTCTPTNLLVGRSSSCTVRFTNTTYGPAPVSMDVSLPAPLQVLTGSISGGTGGGKAVHYNGTLAAGSPGSIGIGTGSTPAGGYVPLSAFGIAPISGMGDETLINFNVPAFRYLGQTWTSLGITSNGYAVVGGGTSSDISINNQYLPNANRPNNVLAPFWTDLNPVSGGGVYVGTLTDGTKNWIVIDWNGVREFSLSRFDSFEIWIGVASNGSSEDFSYAYGTIGGNGDGGFLTVGAENYIGTVGATRYYNGSGALPNSNTELVLTTSPPTIGQTRTVTYQARAVSTGSWTDCARLTSSLLPGIATACVNGTVQ